MKRKLPNGKPVPHTRKKVTQHDRGGTDDEPTESDSSESEHKDRQQRKKPKRFRESDSEVEEVGEETGGATEVIEVEEGSEV